MRSRKGMRPEAVVLLARLHAVRGELEQARALVLEVEAHQAQAQKEDLKEALLQINDQMLLKVARLLAFGGSEQEWDEVTAWARKDAQGQEVIEVLELRGVAALAHAAPQTAQRAWEEALEVTKRVPNVMESRIRARLKALG